jgi:hypothetical protein
MHDFAQHFCQVTWPDGPRIIPHGRLPVSGIGFRARLVWSAGCRKSPQAIFVSHLIDPTCFDSKVRATLFVGAREGSRHVRHESNGGVATVV